MEYIVDANVALKWFFKEKYSLNPGAREKGAMAANEKWTTAAVVLTGGGTEDGGAVMMVGEEAPMPDLS